MFIECVAASAYRTLVLMFHLAQNEPIIMEGEVTCCLLFVRHSCPQVKKLKSRLPLLITSIFYATQHLFWSDEAFLTEQMKFNEFRVKHAC